MVFVISGPSASGKTTLVKHVCKVMPNMEFSISCTTRPRRPEDKGDLSDYEFVEDEEFTRRVKQDYFAEWAVVHGNRYGTPRCQIEKALSKDSNSADIVLDVNVEGADNIKKQFPDAILIFVTPPTIDDLHERLRRRNTENNKSIQRRLLSLKEEISVIDRYDYVIVNGKLGDSLAEIESVIKMFRTRKQRIENIKAAYSGNWKDVARRRKTL